MNRVRYAKAVLEKGMLYIIIRIVYSLDSDSFFSCHFNIKSLYINKDVMMFLDPNLNDYFQHVFKIFYLINALHNTNRAEL